MFFVILVGWRQGKLFVNSNLMEKDFWISHLTLLLEKRIFVLCSLFFFLELVLFGLLIKSITLLLKNITVSVSNNIGYKAI